MSVNAFEETGRHLAPSHTAPGKTLGKSVDLIVVTTWKRQQFRGEVFKPGGAPGKTNRAAREQVALRNHASALVGIGLVNRDIDGLLLQVLDETATDWRVFDEKSSGGIAPFNLHDLPFERVERKPATDHLKNVEHLPAAQQDNTSGIVAGFRSRSKRCPSS